MNPSDTLRWSAFLLAVDLCVWALAFALAPYAPVLSGLAAWSALALFVVSGLYAWASRGGDGASVLVGARWPAMQLVLLPYRLVALTLFRLARFTRREETVCAVAPGLYLGPRLLAGEVDRLRDLGVRAVVDLAGELPPLKALRSDPFAWHAVAVLDRMAPTDAALDAAVAWVVSRVEAGDGVYVHCAFGRGRSALVACASAIALGAATTAEEAERVVKSARPSIRMRVEQRAALARFAERWSRRGA